MVEKMSVRSIVKDQFRSETQHRGNMTMKIHIYAHLLSKKLFNHIVHPLIETPPPTSSPCQSVSINPIPFHNVWALYMDENNLSHPLASNLSIAILSTTINLLISMRKIISIIFHARLDTLISIAIKLTCYSTVEKLSVRSIVKDKFRSETQHRGNMTMKIHIYAHLLSK